MAATSLLWLKEHEPAHYRKARWALQPKDWLRLRFTRQANSEPSDASGTLLYDLLADTWALSVVEALGLRLDLLPPCFPPAPSQVTLRSQQPGIWAYHPAYRWQRGRPIPLQRC